VRRSSLRQRAIRHSAPSCGTIAARTMRPPSRAPCRARGAPSIAWPWPKQWPSLTSLPSKAPHAIGTSRRLSRRSLTAARGSRCPRHPAHASEAVSNRRAPCGHPCTGSPEWT
jgi:hypothetical protein